MKQVLQSIIDDINNIEEEERTELEKIVLKKLTKIIIEL